VRSNNSNRQHALRWIACERLTNLSISDSSVFDQALWDRDWEQAFSDYGCCTPPDRFFHLVVTVTLSIRLRDVDITHTALACFVNAALHPNVFATNKDRFAQKLSKTQC
jgi:hypothetical protein